MSAGKYSFVIEQGATTDFNINYKDNSNNPVNLTGYQARMQIRSDYADSTSTIIANLSSSLLSDNTGLNLSGSNGTTPLSSGSIGLYISAITSSTFTFSEARYDIELISGSTTTRLLEGKIQLSKEVTRV